MIGMGVKQCMYALIQRMATRLALRSDWAFANPAKNESRGQLDCGVWSRTGEDGRWMGSLIFAEAVASLASLPALCAGRAGMTMKKWCHCALYNWLAGRRTRYQGRDIVASIWLITSDVETAVI